MSTFTLFTAGLACFASFASAYTKPVGDSPSGNPITTPGFGSIVTAGEPYKIRWEPTTEGKVTLVLVKGPATNLAVVGPIVESIDNSGSYLWTPSSDLTEGPTPTTGYGIQLIVDATGQYQYTTQFGVSNPHAGHDHSSDNSTLSVYPVSSAAASTTSGAHYHGYESTATITKTGTSAVATSSSVKAATTTAVVVPTTTVASTLITSAVSPSVAPTRASVTSSSTPSGTASARNATSTGGAASFRSGLVGVAAFAGAAVLVM